jgi:hypothetical protein
MEKPNGYELIKFKFLKGGGMSVTFEHETVDGSISNTDTHTIDSPTDPHKDLTTLRDKLKGHFADIFALRMHRTLTEKSKHLTAKEQQSAKALKTAFDKIDVELQRKIEITSIEFKGTEDSAGVVLGGRLNHNDYTSNLKTPVLVFMGNTWGFEEQVSNIVDELCIEVEKYLFENKKADPDLFSEDNGKTQQEEPKAEKESDEKIIEIKTAV